MNMPNYQGVNNQGKKLCKALFILITMTYMAVGDFSKRYTFGTTMFNSIQTGKKLPKYLSSDNDPLFKFHRWRANLRVFEVEEIKSVPYTPTSHPFIERVIGTCRREMLDRTLFWNVSDLQIKLDDFKQYYNTERHHMGISYHTPENKADNIEKPVVDINHFRWKQHCRGLFDLPVAA